MPKLLRFFLPLVALGFVACVPVGTSPSQCRDDLAIEREVFDATNADRANHNIAPVVWDNELAGWAETHSQKMADLGLLHHIDWAQIDTGHWEGTVTFPIGGTVEYGPPADNVIGPAWPPQDGAGLERAWYNSPPHQAHVLEADYTYVGVGVVCAGGAQWATQIFGWRP